VKIETASQKGIEIRRVRVEDLPNESKLNQFEVVKGYIRSSFPTVPSFSLKYKDDEGDLVTIASESEFQEAIRVAAVSNRCLKMYLVEGPKVVKKDSSPIESKKTHVDTIADPLKVEIQFQGKKQPVVVSLSSVNIAALRQNVLTAYPELLTQDFSLKYLDDEGDAVTMTEADELNDAIQQIHDRSNQSLVVVVVINSTQAVSTALVQGSEQSEREKPSTEKTKEEESKTKKKWEDITWDDLNETLEKFQKLGFTDTALCTRLLEKFNYDYDTVVNELRKLQIEKQ